MSAPISGKTKHSETTIVTNANGTAIDVRGDYVGQVFGTWNSATFKIQGSLDGGTNYEDISGLSFTADGNFRFQYRGKIRRVTSGGGGSMDLDWYLNQLDEPYTEV